MTLRPDDHTETVLVSQAEDEDAEVFLVEDFNPEGLDVTRLPRDEFGDSEVWRWRELARRLCDHSARIYGMTPEEVETIDP